MFQRKEKYHVYITQNTYRGMLLEAGRHPGNESIIQMPGIRIGNDVFFNIHALASGGGDAPALVTAVHDNFINMPQINWLIAGDFNRDPALLQSGLDTRIANHIRITAPNSATHFSSRGTNRTLDYAVVGRSSPSRSTIVLPQIAAILMAANIRAHLSSDHSPVHFGRF